MQDGETRENTTATEQSPAIQQLRDELVRQNEMYLRALADFENYRRRVARDRDSEVRRGRRELVLSIVEILDEFDRALQHAAETPEPVMQGIQAIRRKCEALLQAQGLEPVPSKGQRFNPVEHEAVGSVEGEGEPGVVVEQVKRGYRWGGELLRPALVRVRK